MDRPKNWISSLATLQDQLQREQIQLQRMRALVNKIEQARTSGDSFLDTYFMGRRTTSSTIGSELLKAAKDAGMKPKEHSFTFDPIEGSDTLSMMTIVGNYEGTYGDLLQFVNRLDKSAALPDHRHDVRSAAAGHRQSCDQHQVEHFRTGGRTHRMKLGAEPKKVAVLVGLLVVALVVYSDELLLDAGRFRIQSVDREERNGCACRDRQAP